MPIRSAISPLAQALAAIRPSAHPPAIALARRTELYRFAARADLMNDPDWRRGFGLIGEHRLLFELQIFTSQFADGAKLAAAFPGTPFVLMHCGMPEDLSERAWPPGARG